MTAISYRWVVVFVRSRIVITFLFGVSVERETEIEGNTSGEWNGTGDEEP